jgi:TetR/AcrR family transcriptional regulator, regulator of cefoperazone and chloramphenicol sensitivity
MTRPSDHTREAIIKAAVHLFAEKGFDGTSVRDIVTKARVNQAAINYHFKTRMDCTSKCSKPRSKG